MSFPVQMIRRLHQLACAAAVAMAASCAFGQAFPTKPIRIVVPSSAGASTDLLARTSAALLGPRLNGSVVVENDGGGGGLVGVANVSRAAPDGYTLLFTAADGIVILPALRSDLPYDAANGFAPIVKVGDVDVLFAVNPKLPVRDLRELIALAKSRPGELKYGHGGNGSTPHVGAEMLLLRAGISMIAVPYKGAAPAVIAAVAGDVDVLSSGFASMAPQLQSGRLRAIAIASPKRRAFAPDVPTVAESGLPDFAAAAWFGMLAPAGVPAPILARLRTEMAAVANSPEFQSKAATFGLSNDVLVGEEFGKHIARNRTMWAEVIRGANIKLER